MIAKEIGSYFYFNELQFNKIQKSEILLDSKYSYVSTCRSAIEHILISLNHEKRIALVPTFTCHAVIEPFVRCGYEVFPYRIECDFTTKVDFFLEDVKKIKPNVILIHDYFGFNTNKNIQDENLIEELRNQGITIIVDRTQSMFSKYEQLKGDYVVGSIRKWCGIPDGAFTSFNIESNEEDKELVEEKCKAMLYKAKYLTYDEGDKRSILDYYRKAEGILDSRTKAYMMSEISKKLLMNTDVDKISVQRKDNYRTLINGILKNHIISYPHPILGDDEVPFYLPLFVKKDRKAFQSYLAQNNIFATIIWGCPNEIKDKIDIISKNIYQEILCIPCDQRYDTRDMEYVCEVINNYSFERE